MEAVREIAHQLRLRNLGGIIIIDFIDMENEQHREELYTAFQEAMQQGQEQVNILKLSEFGLVQMTRKRLTESLHQMMCEPCHVLRRRRIRQIAPHDLLRHLPQDQPGCRKTSGNTVTVRVHPRIADMLLKEEELTMTQLEKDIAKRLIVAPSKDLHIEKYEIIWQR